MGLLLNEIVSVQLKECQQLLSDQPSDFPSFKDLTQQWKSDPSSRSGGVKATIAVRIDMNTAATAIVEFYYNELNQASLENLALSK